MIAFDDTLVAHYGGAGGATLSIAEPGGEFRVIAEFGRDPKSQAAAQRRLLLTPEYLFVLEPREGVLFADELRVRRFERDGRELDTVEGPGEEGRAQLASLGEQADANSPLKISCFGIDPENGRPLHWSAEMEPQFKKRPWTRRRSPAWLGEDLYVPVPGPGLLRFSAAGPEKLGVHVSQVVVLDGRLFANTQRNGDGAVWVDGASHVVCQGPLHPQTRWFAGSFLAPRPDGGYVVLRANGGELPGLEGAPGRLPAGLYSGLVFGPAGIFAIEESKGPRMVPAEL